MQSDQWTVRKANTGASRHRASWWMRAGRMQSLERMARGKHQLHRLQKQRYCNLVIFAFSPTARDFKVLDSNSLPYWTIYSLAHRRRRIEATGFVNEIHVKECRYNSTFKKFLASVFFEESFMDNWTREIVDHKLKNWLNLLLRITCIMSEGSILDQVNIITDNG